MNETATTEAQTSEAPIAEKSKKEEGSFAWFLVKLVVIVLVFRTFIFTSFSIPSESMMPRLLVGDYLFAAKWPYGYSQASMPLDLDIVPGSGRVFADLPERGDLLLIKQPVDGSDYIWRGIGLRVGAVRLRRLTSGKRVITQLDAGGWSASGDVSRLEVARVLADPRGWDEIAGAPWAADATHT